MIFNVVLELDLTDPARSGPGVWKLNNSLLQDEAFCSEISDLIDAYLSFRHVFSSTKEMWESLKKDFKSTSISFARDRRKELSRDKVLPHQSTDRAEAAFSFRGFGSLIRDLGVRSLFKIYL